MAKTLTGAMCAWVAAEWLLGPRWPFPASTRGLVLIAMALIPGFFAVACGIWRKIPKYAVSLEVDRWMDAGESFTSALCFVQRAERAPMEALVVGVALERLASIDLRKAVPLRHDAWTWLPFCCALGLGTLVPERAGDNSSVRQARVPRSSASIAAAEPAAGVIAQVRAILADLESRITEPQSKSEIGRLRQLTEAWSRGQADARAVDDAALSMMLRLSPESLQPNPEIDGLARALAQHGVTRELAAALAEGRMKDAKQALEALEKRWREPRTRLSPEELRALRKAVEAERARRQRDRAVDSADAQQLAREREELLKKNQTGPFGQADQQRLEAVTRRLSHLDQRRRAAEQVEPAMTALDRAILEAAEALGKELAMDLDGFERAENELARLDPIAKTEAGKRELLEKIRQIRELLRQRDHSSPPRISALERFGWRARGDDDDTSESRRGSKQVGASAQPNPSGQVLALEVVPIPMGVEPESAQVGPGSPAGPASGAPASAGPSNATGSNGDYHEAKLRGDPSPGGARPGRDVTAVSGDSGAGTISAEVVATAGLRGFARPEYGEVFRAYEPVTEAWLSQPNVPFSHKEQVRRYFQLIRPRESPP